MNVIAKFIKIILIIPLLAFISPVLLLFAFAILVLETQEGTLRELFWLEVKAYGWASGFRRFMQKIFIPTYKNSVQGFVLGGAGFLVMTVGLRSLGILSTEYVYAALAVEFLLLLMWGTMTYFTPHETSAESYTSPQEQSPTQVLTNTLKELNRQITQLDARLKTSDGRLDHFVQVQTTLQSLVQKIETVLGANPQIHALKESNEKIANTMKELTAQLALLESRLRSTEAKFNTVDQVDEAIKALTQRIELIVSDQFNLRVKNEFEQLLSEIGSRIAAQQQSYLK